MTEKLYYQDVCRTEFTGTVQNVISEEGNLAVELDQTAFYPEGGGQPADRGMLVLPDGRTLEVTDVQETDGRILHVVPILKTETQEDLMQILPGQELHGIIDWERRFDHMQQHSGEHIVSGMICRRFQCDNVGFHLGADIVTIDFNARISMQEAEEIEAQANQYIWEDHPFEEFRPSEEERKTLAYRSKKELEGEVRITRFPGADTCACCGTHVLRSGQVGLVKFLSARSFHGGTRLELLCGKRALQFLALNYHVNKAAAVLLSSDEEHTAEHVEKLLQEHLHLKTEIAAMGKRLLHQLARSCQEKGNVCLVDETLSPEQARPLADLIADCCNGMAAVFVREEDRYRYAIIQRNSEISDFIREMNQALEGRGGGRNGFAQGSVNASSGKIQAYFAADPLKDTRPFWLADGE